MLLMARSGLATTTSTQSQRRPSTSSTLVMVVLQLGRLILMISRTDAALNLSRCFALLTELMVDLRRQHQVATTAHDHHLQSLLFHLSWLPQLTLELQEFLVNLRRCLLMAILTRRRRHLHGGRLLRLLLRGQLPEEQPAKRRDTRSHQRHLATHNPQHLQLDPLAPLLVDQQPQFLRQTARTRSSRTPSMSCQFMAKDLARLERSEKIRSLAEASWFVLMTFSSLNIALLVFTSTRTPKTAIGR
jgi:hypothetical protein